MLNYGRKKATAIIVLAALFAAQTMFIISNSMRSAEASSNQSGFFVKFVIVEMLGLDYNKQSEAYVDSVTHFVRKAAHFSEFAVLGGIAFVLLYIVTQNKTICFIGASSAAFLVGCADEIIQLYSPGRACRFTDVLIDTSGGVFACFVLALLLCLAEKRKNILRGKNGQI